MRFDNFQTPLSRVFVLLVLSACFAPSPCVATSGPVFATLPPTSGSAGGSFFVFLPITNTGGSSATNIQVTAATLGPVALQSPTLPFSLSDLAPGTIDESTLTFSSSSLISGKNYLLTVRGTYRAGGTTFGFAVSRILTFGKPSPFQLPANPLSVTPTLDSSHSVKQPISASKGGTLSATGADGSVFTLVIPPKALLNDELITLTPVSAITGLPVSNGLLAAVQFAPEGLLFQQPATLTIQPAVSVPVGQQVGFGYHGSGAEFHFQPLGLTQAITFSILHFSGVGVGQGTPAADGTPTSTLDRLDNAEAPLLAIERQTLFPTDPPPNQQAQAESAGLLQQYFEQVLQPELQAAESNDAQAVDAVKSSIDLSQQLQPLISGPGTFQADLDFIHHSVPLVVANAYDNALARCEGDTSENARLLEAEKMQWLFSAPQAVGAGGSAAFPNFNSDLTTCIAGPLEMTYDTKLIGSGAVGAGGALTLNGEVKADQVPMLFSSSGYFGTGPLFYSSLFGVVTWPPPVFDCGSNFVGGPGTINAEAKFDLNIDPSTILTPDQIELTLTVFPDIMEFSTFAAEGPMTPCASATIPTTLYLALYIVADGFGPATNSFAPFVVHLGIPEPINLHATVPIGNGVVTANIVGTVTLSPQNP
jgi:hypothetical protein